jgi:hypothetical protein
MEMFSYVSEHPQVVENAAWKERADRIHKEMWKLYQDIGLSDEPDTADPKLALIRQVQDILSITIKLGSK